MVQFHNAKAIVRTLIFGVLLSGLIVACLPPNSAAQPKDDRPLPDGFTRVTLPPGKLPEGVIHLKLPPGEYSVQDIERDGKVILRITASKLIVETRSFFIGDGNGAALIEAPKKQRLNYREINEPGSRQYFERFVQVEKLKPGSLYITTPSIFVGWFKTAKPKGNDAPLLPNKGNNKNELEGESTKKVPNASTLPNQVASAEPLEITPIETITSHIKQLGSDNSKARETAMMALKKIGADALPFLEPAMRTGNLELRRRAETLHEEILAQVPNPKLPEGVFLMKLSPGTVSMESIVRNDKPIIRLSVDKTVVEAANLFLGDGKGAIQFQAHKDGLYWLSPTGNKTQVGNGMINEPGSTLEQANYVPAEKLMAGSLYVTTTSIRFEFGLAAKIKRPR